MKGAEMRKKELRKSLREVVKKADDIKNSKAYALADEVLDDIVKERDYE